MPSNIDIFTKARPRVIDTDMYFFRHIMPDGTRKAYPISKELAESPKGSEVWKRYEDCIDKWFTCFRYHIYGFIDVINSTIIDALEILKKSSLFSHNIKRQAKGVEKALSDYKKCVRDDFKRIGQKSGWYDFSNEYYELFRDDIVEVMKNVYWILCDNNENYDKEKTYIVGVQVMLRQAYHLVQKVSIESKNELFNTYVSDSFKHTELKSLTASWSKLYDALPWQTLIDFNKDEGFRNAVGNITAKMLGEDTVIRAIQIAKQY